MTPITPYTDPTLEYLGEWLDRWLNERQPNMVKRWIVSEVGAYQPGDYPLLQLQCLSSTGEAFEHCSGSIRYAVVNQSIVMGDRQQLGFRYQARLIARGIRQFIEQTDWEKSPIKVVPNKLSYELRSGTLKLADGSNGPAITWVEVFFDYKDCSPLEC